MLAERAFVLSMTPEIHRPMIAAMSDVPGANFATMKLENSFTRSLGLAFNLNSIEATSQRRSAVEQLCTLAGNSAASKIILAAANSVRGSLSMLHLPVIAIGVDVTSNDVREIKSYLRVDRCDEFLDRGKIEGHPTTPELEMACLEKALSTTRPDRLPRCRDLVNKMQKAGAAFEMLGVDVHGEDIEIKLYFWHRASDGIPAAFPQKAAQTIITTALSACGLDEHFEASHRFIEALAVLGLPCNQIAIEDRIDGTSEVKITFDTWRLADPDPVVHMQDKTTRKAIEAVYTAVGREPDACDTLLERAQQGRHVVDAFTADFAHTKSGAKLYLRPADDRGKGVDIGEPTR